MRSKDGLVIHRSTCRYASQGVEWRWAAGRDEAWIRSVADIMQYRICGKCL